MNGRRLRRKGAARNVSGRARRLIFKNPSQLRLRGSRYQRSANERRKDDGDTKHETLT